MDIFEQAKITPYVDYYDIHTGYIYCIAEYTRAKETIADYPEQIRVVDGMTRETIGYAKPR